MLFVCAWPELQLTKLHGKVKNLYLFSWVFWLLLGFISCFIFYSIEVNFTIILEHNVPLATVCLEFCIQFMVSKHFSVILLLVVWPTSVCFYPATGQSNQSRVSPVFQQIVASPSVILVSPSGSSCWKCHLLRYNLVVSAQKSAFGRKMLKGNVLPVFPHSSALCPLYKRTSCGFAQSCKMRRSGACPNSWPVTG